MYNPNFSPNFFIPPPPPPPPLSQIINPVASRTADVLPPPPPPPPHAQFVMGSQSFQIENSPLPLPPLPIEFTASVNTVPPPPPPPYLPLPSESDYDPFAAAESSYDPFEAAESYVDGQVSVPEKSESKEVSVEGESEDVIAALAAAELELEKERAEHSKRVAVENKKRRFGSKSIGGLRKSMFPATVRQPDSKKMKAAFDDSDDEGVESISKIESVTASDVASLPEDIRITVKGTADWMVNNAGPAIESLLLRAQDDPRLSFIFDTAGSTPAGRLYIDSLALARARSEVHRVTSGATDLFPNFQQLEAERVKREKEQAVAAAARSALEAAQKRTASIEAKAEAERKKAEAERLKAEAEEFERSQKSLMIKAAAAAAILAEEAEIAKIGESERRSYEVATAAAAVLVEHETEILTAALCAVNDEVLEKKVRRTRWGRTVDTSITNSETQPVRIAKPLLPVSKFSAIPSSINKELQGNVATSKQTSIATFSMPRTEEKGLALPETMDAAADKQLLEQQELKRLEARIREAALRQSMGGIPGIGAAAKLAKQQDLHEERLREYEELAARADEEFRDTIEMAEANRGIIEGGTWEHRKRAREMLATADSALNLTLTASSKGGTHIGQYLPKEELDRFLRESKAIAGGQAVETIEDFEKNKLDESNLGYQLLQRAGWKEGEGLGKDSSGAAIPVNMAGAGESGGGLGVISAGAIEEGDNEFDQYRKRMMLAYKFRPNPLNNPRRAYY